ncbi:MAG: hypothetical protein H6739_22740 [Alphaproteobacteria bacterium]|nr:hypothetical protein [Alphaproteobacteria bacterium]
MARKEKVDRVLEQRLDDFEREMFLLKIAYEKYFSGIDKVEPLRDREALRRTVRDLIQVPIMATSQKFRMRTLRARYNTLDLYLNRNMNLIERGEHPKFKFRADLTEQKRARDDLAGAERALQLDDARKKREREDAAFRQIYEHYIEARRKCGQSTDLEFDSVKKALRTQVRTIKSTYKCNSVKFRVTVEDGKARLKAVPQR